MATNEERKQNKWGFSIETGLLICELPGTGNEKWGANLYEAFPHVKALDENEKNIFQYGIRQYLSDDTAKVKGETLDNKAKILTFDNGIKEMIAGTYWNRKGKSVKLDKLDKLTDDEIMEFAEEAGIPFPAAKMLLEKIKAKK